MLKSSMLYIFILFIVNFLLRVPLNSQGFFAFTYDQGRDLLAVSKIVYEHIPTLIGPTTGLQGVFYGPWWYYFLSVPVFVTGGNPQGVANFFSIISILTIVSLFLLLRKITGLGILAFLLSLCASMSSMWMFWPVTIWNTSLVPVLFILFLFVVLRTAENKKPVNFFLLGILSFLIMDFELPFGLMLSLFVLLSVFVFRAKFLKKDFIFTILGMLAIFSPRVLFDLKHNFLITKNALSFFSHPAIYGEETTFVQRILQRSDLYLGIFSQSFTRGNKYLGVLILVLAMCGFFYLLKQGKIEKALKRDLFFKYILLLFVFSYFFFSVYQDTVWDYYLVGLPVLFLVILAKIFFYVLKIEKLKKPVFLLLFALVVLNFNSRLLSPYEMSWQGDGSIYRNEKAVVDEIAAQKPKSWSYHAYTPAMFDYPFDYLVYWYARKGIIEKPQKGQSEMFLIIRDTQSQRYLKTGWYGDKTRDKTNVVFRKNFTGDLLLEKHTVVGSE